MSKQETRRFSEPVRQAGESFDKFQGLTDSQADLAAKLKAANKARLRETDPQELERLRQEIVWLSEQVAALEVQKRQAAAEVGGFMDKHQAGEALMDKSEPKHIN